MKKYPTISFFKTSLLYMLVLTFLGALGCAGVGSNIPPERREPLVEGENNPGNFSYGPLTVDYSYTVTGSNMVVGGSNMILAGKASYQGGADSLDVRILFLDATGVILQQKIIYSSGYRSGNTKGSNRVFQKTLNVPPGSAAITFTYSATDRSSQR
ncbi:MAG: hypothetical protein BA866_13465 [Desulfobulbaceae bacterium S5133MH15]|nr:MAG: hypothetical protein BA866_13465 [Desulfobulbaceae bacterium S5133MH15]